MAKSHVLGVRANRACHSGSTLPFPQLSGVSKAKLLQDSIWKGIFWPNGSTQKIPFHPSKTAVALPSPPSKYGYTCTHTCARTHTHTREGSIHRKLPQTKSVSNYPLEHFPLLSKSFFKSRLCSESAATISAGTISTCFQVTWRVPRWLNHYINKAHISNHSSFG